MDVIIVEVNVSPFCIRPLVNNVNSTQQIQKVKLAQIPPLGSCERGHNVRALLTKTLS